MPFIVSPSCHGRRLRAVPRDQVAQPSDQPRSVHPQDDGRVRSVFLGGETWARLDPVSG
jgi:hypothetical protein